MKLVVGWLTTGIHWYQFEWNAQAHRLFGLHGPAKGILSTEVKRVLPHAVHRDSNNGYEYIDWVALLQYMKQQRARGKGEKGGIGAKKCKPPSSTVPSSSHRHT